MSSGLDREGELARKERTLQPGEEQAAPNTEQVSLDWQALGWRG